MKIEDHLDQQVKDKLNKWKKRKRKKKKEKLSFHDLENMMGKYDSTLYRGKGGAWK